MSTTDQEFVPLNCPKFCFAPSMPNSLTKDKIQFFNFFSLIVTSIYHLLNIDFLYSFALFVRFIHLNSCIISGWMISYVVLTRYNFIYRSTFRMIFLRLQFCFLRLCTIWNLFMSIFNMFPFLFTIFSFLFWVWITLMNIVVGSLSPEQVMNTIFPSLKMRPVNAANKNNVESLIPSNIIKCFITVRHTLTNLWVS